MTIMGIVPVVPTQFTENITIKDLVLITITILVIVLFLLVIPSQLAKIWRRREGIEHKLNIELRDIVKLVKKGRVKGLVCKIQGKYKFLPTEAISFEYTDEYPYTYVRTRDGRIPVKDCEVIYNILSSHQLHNKEDDSKALKIRFIATVVIALAIGNYLLFSLSKSLLTTAIMSLSLIFVYSVLLHISIVPSVAEWSQKIGEDKKRKLLTADGILYKGVYYPKDTLTILDGTCNFVKLPDDRIVPLKDCEIMWTESAHHREAEV